IRDRTVTGVQTCALPIWDLFTVPSPPSWKATPGPYLRSTNAAPEERPSWHSDSGQASLRVPGNRREDPIRGVARRLEVLPGLPRSEERRVGKECRTG